MQYRSSANSRAPLLFGASTTTAATHRPAVIRFLARKKAGCRFAPGGYSLMTAPAAATSRAVSPPQLSSSMGEPSTPMQLPPAISAPCAAVTSTPTVRPDTTSPPQRVSS